MFNLIMVLCIPGFSLVDDRLNVTLIIYLTSRSPSEEKVKVKLKAPQALGSERGPQH